MSHANSKPWWKSRTLLFNLASGLAAVFAELASALVLVEPHLPDSFYPRFAAAVVLGNVVLRCVTSVALEFKSEGKNESVS